jgi:hypothetical protein
MKTKQSDESVMKLVLNVRHYNSHEDDVINPRTGENIWHHTFWINFDDLVHQTTTEEGGLKLVECYDEDDDCDLTVGEKLTLNSINQFFAEDSGLPKFHNSRHTGRLQHINHGVYKRLKAEIRAERCQFHIHNSGITLFAKKINDEEILKQVKRNGTIELYLAAKDIGTPDMIVDGIVNGGHTYEVGRDVILKNECPKGQCVKVFVMTGVPASMRWDISRDLNAVEKNKLENLINLEKKFDWIKELVHGERWADDIKYEEVQKGKIKIDYIVRLFYAFLPQVSQMVRDSGKMAAMTLAYNGRGKVLAFYRENSNMFKGLAPIAKEILILAEYERVKARELYNQIGNAGLAKRIFEDKECYFPFLDIDAKYPLYDGPFFALVSAWRSLVEQQKDGTCRWKIPFPEVKKLFDMYGAEMIKIIYEAKKAPDKVGKDSDVWSNLHSFLQLRLIKKYGIDIANGDINDEPMRKKKRRSDKKQ